MCWFASIQKMPPCTSSAGLTQSVGPLLSGAICTWRVATSCAEFAMLFLLTKQPNDLRMKTSIGFSLPFGLAVGTLVALGAEAIEVVSEPNGKAVQGAID